MERINVAELLKDCPKGMELDCVMCDDIVFEGIDFSLPKYQIIIKKRKTNVIIYLTKYGQYEAGEDYKCIIFPKGKTTWEGFVPPCEFKDGDILVTDLGSIFILKEPNEDVFYYSCYIALNHVSCILGDYTQFCAKKDCRLASEEEKEKLFKAIKDNGYRWNFKTKTMEELIVPKFKVGDRIKKNKDYISGIITNISDDDTYKVEYRGGGVSYVSVAYQDEWELVSDKFDISTLRPFDKVLARDDVSKKWRVDFFSKFEACNNYPYYCIGGIYKQCIPYEGNEHLWNTTNDCSDYYKTWE